MQSTAGKALPGQITPLGDTARITILLSIVANILLIFGCIALSSTIGGLDNATQFGNLGRPVQTFVQVLVLVPAIIAAVSTVGLVMRHPVGRYGSLVIQYVGFVLAIAGLLQVWGFFLGFEYFVDTIISNGSLTLGFALAYAVYWLSGRLDETNVWRSRLTQVAMIIGAGTLVLLILASDFLATINSVIDSYGRLDTWILTISAVVLGVLAWRMLKLGDTFGETPEQRDAWQGWLMLSPNIIGFTLFFAGPLLLSFYLSFTNSSVGVTPEFIGLKNYTDIVSLEFQWLDNVEATRQSVLSVGYTPLGSIQLGARELVIGAKDVIFWRSMRNTFVFCLLLLPLAIIPALFLSLILNSKLPGVKFYRAIYFLPSVAAVVGTALIWRWLYDPTIGFFNYFIEQIVTFLNSTFGTSVADPNIAWLTGPGVVLFSVVFLAAWQVVGFNTVLFLAGLQGIPNSLYEAAQIDGANRWQQFRNVTLPMLAPTTFFVIITTVITGLQVFNEPYALFPARPIPIEATTAVYYLYDKGFPQGQFGYSSSVAWILFVLIFLVTLAQFRFSRSDAYDD